MEGHCVDWMTDMRIFWADVQRVFLLPLLIIFSVFFFFRQEHVREVERVNELRVSDLAHRLEMHEVIPGHAESWKNASVIAAKLDAVILRLDRIERKVGK